MRRRVKGAMKTVVVVAIAVGAFSALPPSSWRKAEHTMRRHFRSIEMMIRPVAERAADWIHRQNHSLRDRFDAIEDVFEAVAGTRKEERGACPAHPCCWCVSGSGAGSGRPHSRCGWSTGSSSRNRRARERAELPGGWPALVLRLRGDAGRPRRPSLQQIRSQPTTAKHDRPQPTLQSNSSIGTSAPC